MKEKLLREYIGNLTKKGVLVAFSGGVDSTLVLKIALEEGRKRNGKVTACTFETFLSPENDIEVTRKLAEEYGVELVERYIDQTNNSFVLNNSVDRCFHCKKVIFQNALEIAEKYNLKYVLDGTNHDDLGVYRPGLRALKELGIKSPLAECGFTKKEVRELAEKMGISVAKRPSAPCLATRFPYNKKLPIEKFSMIDKGEEILKEYGFLINRIRLYDDVTRIEIPVSDFEKFIKKREEIIKALKNLGFKYINLDMEGFRSGSMDEVI